MAVMNITLTESLNSFVSEMVQSGRYHSGSEVISQALHLLEEREKHLTYLCQLLEEGIASGECNESFDTIVAQAKAELNV